LTFFGAGVTAQNAQYFDFEHVVRSIRYLEDPSARNLELLAQTEAMQHLKRPMAPASLRASGTIGLSSAACY